MDDATYIVLNTLIRLVPNVGLIVFVFRNRLRFSLWQSNVIAVAFCGFTVAVLLLLFSVYNPIENWLPAFSIAYLLLCITIFIAGIRVSVFQGLFVLIVIENYSNGFALFSKIVQTYLFYDTGDHFSRVTYLLSLLIVLAATLPFMLLFMLKYMRPMLEANEQKPFWRYLWIVPTSFYMIYRLSIYPTYLNPSIMLTGPQVFWSQCAWTIGSFLSYYIILRMLSETEKNSELAMRLHISDIQLTMQKEQYEMLKRSIEEANRVRHDLRHHLLAMKGYISRQDFSGISAYLEHSLHELAPEDGIPVCENYAVNAIAQYYIALAKKNEIDITFRLDLPEKLPIPANDFCVVFANLLENAAEACIRQSSGRKFIQIRIGMQSEKTIVIAVKNSFNTKIHCSRGQFMSSKRAGAGIGTASVRSVADKYHGMVNFTYDSAVFHVTALLNAQD